MALSMDALVGQLRHSEQRIEELTAVNLRQQETNSQLQKRITALNTQYEFLWALKFRKRVICRKPFLVVYVGWLFFLLSLCLYLYFSRALQLIIFISISIFSFSLWFYVSLFPSFYIYYSLFCVFSFNPCA